MRYSFLTAPTPSNLRANLDAARIQHATLSGTKELKPDSTTLPSFVPRMETQAEGKICSTIGYRYVSKQEDRATIGTFDLPPIFQDHSTDPMHLATTLYSALIALPCMDVEYKNFIACGAAAAGALVTPQGVFGFGSGDSATFLITVTKEKDSEGVEKFFYHVRPLTTIHTAEYNPDECKRIECCGGKLRSIPGSVSGLLRLEGVTVPLRGVGDLRLAAKGMTHHPDITYVPHEIHETTTHFVLAVSDGVLDHMGALQIEEWLDQKQFSPDGLEIIFPHALITKACEQAYPHIQNIENTTAVMEKIDPACTTAKLVLVIDGHGPCGEKPAEWVTKHFPRSLMSLFQKTEAFFRDAPAIPATTEVEEAASDSMFTASIQETLRSFSSLFHSMKLLYHDPLEFPSHNPFHKRLQECEERIRDFYTKYFFDLNPAFMMQYEYRTLQEKIGTLNSFIEFPNYCMELWLGLERLHFLLFERRMMKLQPDDCFSLLIAPGDTSEAPTESLRSFVKRCATINSDVTCHFFKEKLFARPTSDAPPLELIWLNRLQTYWVTQFCALYTEKEVDDRAPLDTVPPETFAVIVECFRTANALTQLKKNALGEASASAAAERR